MNTKMAQATAVTKIVRRIALIALVLVLAAVTLVIVIADGPELDYNSPAAERNR